MQDKFALSVQEAADALGGITRDHLYSLINKGQLRSVKLGRRRVIPVDAIRECLEANEDTRGVA